MTKTNMAVLEQACRNTRGECWLGGQTAWGMKYPAFTCENALEGIRREYHRLMRLKASKKRWRS